MQLRKGQLVLSPSDLTNYLACRHLAALEFDAARGKRTKPHTREALTQLIAEKGELHEQRYLEYLKAQGCGIVEVELPHHANAFEEAHATTVAAMRAGAEVIYQATFVRAGWGGRADFVIRVDEPSDLGHWSYEPWDTKLGSNFTSVALVSGT